MARNGKLDYKTQWKEEDNIKIDDVKKTYIFIYELIDKINQENKTLEIIKPEEYNFKFGFIFWNWNRKNFIGNGFFLLFLV